MRSPTIACSTLVLVLGGSSGAARAQSDATRDAQPVQTAPPGAPTTAPPNAPTIAPPAPAAPPEKVEKAKATAETAQLHPIVPSPQNPLRPAFQLYAEIDVPVIAIGIVFAAARRFRSTQPAFCAPLCNPDDLNPVDRVTAGYWSPGWQTASDYGLYGVAVGAVTLLLLDEGPASALNDAVVIAETGLAATALASVMTLASARPRPYMYGEKAPLSARFSPDGSLSFLSSHAAISFGIATSTFMTMRRLHPRSNTPWIVLGVGGALAAGVSAARVLGGMHFISDSIGGATVGASLGVLIPSLHQSPVAIVPVTGDAGQHGLALVAHF
jgi:membrane-associated phospholipid phosphatase